MCATTISHSSLLHGTKIAHIYLYTMTRSTTGMDMEMKDTGIIICTDGKAHLKSEEIREGKYNFSKDVSKKVRIQ